MNKRIKKKIAFRVINTKTEASLKRLHPNDWINKGYYIYKTMSKLPFFLKRCDEDKCKPFKDITNDAHVVSNNVSYSNWGVDDNGHPIIIY